MYLMYMHLKSEEKIFNFLNFQNPLLFFFFFYPSLFFPPVPISIILEALHQIECLLPLPCGMVAAVCVCGGAGGAERMTEGVEKESDRVTL